MKSFIKCWTQITFHADVSETPQFVFNEFRAIVGEKSSVNVTTILWDEKVLCAFFFLFRVKGGVRLNPNQIEIEMWLTLVQSGYNDWISMVFFCA